MYQKREVREQKKVGSRPSLRVLFLEFGIRLQ